MIDIARAKLPGGDAGEYQIGRERSLSALVLSMFGISVPQFVEIVRKAGTDDEVAERLWSAVIVDPALLSARLQRITVADVPAELRPDFERLYGADLPAHRVVFDVLDADDAQAFFRPNA